MNAISAINNTAYMIKPIRPISSRDGSQGIIADVPSEKQTKKELLDTFKNSDKNQLETYSAAGQLSKSERNIASGELNKNDNESINDKIDYSESPANQELTESEKKQIQELKKIDREVRAHEQAHKSAGGGLIRGGPNYTYQRGPDNKRYAVGGEVQIDMSPVPNNPQATIQKMQQVKRAAMAPSDPSPQDRSAAAKASQIEAKARQELAKEMIDNMSSNLKNNDNENNQLSKSIKNSSDSMNAMQKRIIDRYSDNSENRGNNVNMTVGQATLKK